MPSGQPSTRIAFVRGNMAAEAPAVERVEVRPLEAGVVLGGAYRILHPLADGGMGIIYRGEHIPSGERRSIEVMHGPFVSDAGLRPRFVREMRLAASIPSDHVAQIVDAGQDEVTHALYVVMEPLEGTMLSTSLARQGPLAWPMAVAVLRQIAGALRAAHARGIVHRDLKPESVLLSHAPRTALSFAVKVLDFGVSKAIFSTGEGAPAAIASSPWMAPELSSPAATGGGVGPQSDVWSFGLLAFSLLTGDHYFPNDNAHSGHSTRPDGVLGEAAIEDLAMASARATQLGAADRLPAQFDAWFERCVDRNPHRRFEDVQTACDALAGLPPPAHVEPQRPVSRSVAPPPIPDDPEDTLEVAPSVSAYVEPSPEPMASANPPGTAAEALPRPASTSVGEVVPAREHVAWLGPTFVVAAGLAGAVLAVLLFAWIRTRETMPSAAAAQTPLAANATAIVLRLHGSNTIGAELAPALADAFLRRRTGASKVVRRRVGPDELVVEARDGAVPLQAIEIAAHGSATAFQDLGAGLCDIGMASRRIHDEEAIKLGNLGDLTSAASEHVIALDGIAVIVNPINPVSLLTRDQIADIFSGKTRRWSGVGGKDEAIVVHARDDKSGTYDTFAHTVLSGRGLTVDATRHESSDELSDAVAANARAIGFIGLPYIRHAKALMVQDTGSVPLLP